MFEQIDDVHLAPHDERAAAGGTPPLSIGPVPANAPPVDDPAVVSDTGLALDAVPLNIRRLDAKGA